ncbi:MAG TPA: hypothetical protein PKJ99_09695 [Thermoanaerobaculales bacterium]|nr:hypothetical protein [Thermoanaerobaculales bacterium]HQP33747.1 hypothetical protein [Polyangiaceae bacterium]
MATTRRQCAYCRKTLDIGQDVLGAHHGVLGHQRFIPLDDLVVLCSEECLCHYFNGTPKLPPRVP